MFDQDEFTRQGLEQEQREKAEKKTAAEEWLRRAIADALERHVRPRLPELEGYKLTLLARIDANPDADVVVTEDERAGLFAIIDRRVGRPDPVTLSCSKGHAWKDGQGRREGPSEWTGGVVLDCCPECGEPGLPLAKVKAS